MSVPSTDENTFIDDLTAILGRARGPRERDSRIALFESLSRLEKQAFVGGASALTLGRLAESRFLAGILRESVSPVCYQSVRGPRHLWTAAPDFRASHEPA